MNTQENWLFAYSIQQYINYFIVCNCSGADELLPILSFIVVKTGQPEILTDCSLLMDMVQERLLFIFTILMYMVLEWLLFYINNTYRYGAKKQVFYINNNYRYGAKKLYFLY